MHPSPSPMPPNPPDPGDTGEYPVILTRKEKRTLKRAVMALATAIPLLLGGGAWSHFASREHTDNAVGERMAALEARRLAMEERLTALELKVDQMRDDQAQDTKAILKAIEGRR